MRFRVQCLVLKFSYQMDGPSLRGMAPARRLVRKQELKTARSGRVRLPWSGPIARAEERSGHPRAVTCWRATGRCHVIRGERGQHTRGWVVPESQGVFVCVGGGGRLTCTFTGQGDVSLYGGAGMAQGLQEPASKTRDACNESLAPKGETHDLPWGPVSSSKNGDKKASYFAGSWKGKLSQCNVLR